MKRSLILIAMFAGACASGTETPAPQAATPAVPQPGGQTPRAQPAAAATAQRTAANAQQTAAPQAAANPTIPDGARYTIFCNSFAGPDHVAVANEMKSLLLKNTQLRGWYVIHDSGQSSLYQGYYRETDPAQPGLAGPDRNDAERARRDKQLLDSIPNPRNPQAKLFPRSLFVPLDAPDPDAPPAWNLSNAEGFWSVQIAAYTGAERKQAALESVRAARQMGIPAYYYHGNAISSVCIGAWPAEAVKRQSSGVAQPRNEDPNQKVIVNAGERALDEEEIRRIGGGGDNVRVLEQKLEILDPTLRKTLADYPEHAVDGQVQMVRLRTQEGGEVLAARPSMLVQIQRGPSVAQQSGGGIDSAPEPSLLNPNRGTGSRDLGNRLRGLGQ